MTPMPRPKYLFGLGTDLSERYIYTLAGDDLGAKLRDINRYDTESDTWTTLPEELPSTSIGWISSAKGMAGDLWLYSRNSGNRLQFLFKTETETVEELDTPLTGISAGN